MRILVLLNPTNRYGTKMAPHWNFHFHDNICEDELQAGEWKNRRPFLLSSRRYRAQGSVLVSAQEPARKGFFESLAQRCERFLYA